MLRSLVAVVLVVCGCGSANRHVGRAALVTSTLAIICDGMQTLSTAGNGWTLRDGRRAIEGNPLMGERPSIAAVAGYFVGAVVVNAAAWVLTPEKYRAPLPIVVTAAQIRQIADNTPHTGVCGMRIRGDHKSL